MTTEPTYELCYDPRDEDMLIYRSIRAGICGPFSDTVSCESREQAEKIARSKGYAIVGAWKSYTNYDSAPLVHIAG